MLTIAICDDDEKLCFKIEEYILAYGKEHKIFLNIDVFFSGEKLYEKLAEGRFYDLIYLDIELQILSGIDVGNKIRQELNNNLTQIIYISSFKKYMEELFRIRPMDFLAKPINRDKIQQTIDIGIKLCKGKNQVFTYQIGWEFNKQPIEEILYFEAEQKLIHMYTVKECISFHTTLKKIYESLKEAYFVYINKSILVNYKYIQGFTRDRLIMFDGTVLPVSRLRYPELKRYQQTWEAGWFSDDDDDVGGN